MLNKYEELLEEAAAQNISVDENFPFHGNLKGLYVDQNIALSDQLETSAEKACILAEELGHHYTSVGNILDISDPANAKQERQARMWTYERLIGLRGLIDAYQHGCREYHETAEFLDKSSFAMPLPIIAQNMESVPNIRTTILYLNLI